MLPNVLQPREADHVPVLAEEVRELPRRAARARRVVDATFGAGGHAAILAADLRGKGKLIAIDRDPTARTYFEQLAKRTHGERALLRGDFGVVLPQLPGTASAPTRSCSTSASPRCSSTGRSAASRTRPTRRSTCGWIRPARAVARASSSTRRSERDLATIFRRYGEERYATQIARAIVRRRREQPFERTGELVDTIRAAIPAPARFGDGHPAKRVFQALRIAVNDELDSLEAALPAALEMLRPGGRLAVITFHSLEDRIVKRFLRERRARLHLPARLPGLRLRPRARAAGAAAAADPPGHAELAANPRSASARLRAAVKTERMA